MHTTRQITTLLTLVGILTTAPVMAEGERELAKNFSYILGLQTGNHIRKQLHSAIDDINLESMQLGINDAMHGRKPKFDIAEITFWSGHFMKMLEERSKAKGEQNLANGKQFLTDYAKREGVETASSGLAFRELRAGKGRQPGIGQTVRIHYRGLRIDGAEFSRSDDNGGTGVEVVLRKTLGGWQEALTLMSPGAKWEVVIPPALAYGAKGQGNIEPNETLVFELELLE
ncbi:MAG: hypothetical protein HOI95_22010, partial [Chromatiales bacterium]|nr:hypothetical protein [Chromatiales bacterium]